MTAEADTVTGTATLRAYGRVAWPDLRDACSAEAAAWADYDGFHIGHIPDIPPPYTHLWACSAGWLLRARIDGDHAIVAVLQVGPTTPGKIAAVGSPSLVHYTARDARTWPSHEKRLGPIPATIAGRPVRLWQIDGDRPVTFVGWE